ncbi:RagB/SusD family nutrient uptake outer membrane protein [Robertkochia solimangrovi]|uniref:RagB/SusD family nutrient uptake outer membrane protein n=1 Tax=Robertkochia solimangrovi TaxID=2213046 RepID=UPI00117D0A6A|nr:RagB/SusD family nutrient uptake outer membrane protein [Robertkochia solimangrovi]TRZ43300.1 RagB/SusD family nutrient uptake outer membrane protein [Robertkochia solimangrovi]
MKYISKILLGVSFLGIVACHSDLDQSPIDPDSLTEEDVYASTEEAKSALAKVYAGLSLTGQQGPSGQADISDIDEGTSQFTRMLFSLNELTTDHAVVGWGDPGLPNLHNLNWGAGNDFTQAMYYRLAQVVTFSNSFIAQASSLADDAEVQAYIAEARFLRAYAYYNLIDLYANVPLVTEITTVLPEQSDRATIFAFIESELLEIQDQLYPARSNEYGRVDEAAAWALLSRLYLNAEVYTGTNRYADCMTYSEKVVNSGYTLNTNDANGNGSAYDELFLADNDTNGAQNEFIFALNFDGQSSQTYGGSTYLIKAAIGGDMTPSQWGVNGGWAGNRSTKSLVQKFDQSINGTDEDGYPISWGDARAKFYTDGQTYEIETVANTFGEGYALTKFSNVKSDGSGGNDTTGEFTDTDIPLIRTAEIYLNYAEAAVRSGGNMATALDLINQIRLRANAAPVSQSVLTPQFVLDERSRELHWEGLRRTDLIRFGQFTSANYLWPFKGGVTNGRGVESFRTIFPIPENVLNINKNLTQNPGY